MIGVLIAIAVLAVFFYVLLRRRTLDSIYGPWVKLGSWNGQTYYARQSLLEPKKWPTYQFLTDEHRERFFQQQRLTLDIETRIGMSVMRPESIVTIASVY